MKPMMSEILVPVIFIVVTIAFIAIAAFAIRLNDSFDLLNNSQKSIHSILKETQTETRSNTDSIMISRDKLAEALAKLEEIEAIVAALSAANSQYKAPPKKAPANQ